MKYTLIDEKREYALILRGERMTQYAVVISLDKETGNWDWMCCHYDFGGLVGLTKSEAFLKALDYYLLWASEKLTPWARMGEIVTALNDGLIEDDNEAAYRYIVDVAESLATKMECCGPDMEQYKAVAEEDAYIPPSSTRGNYGPANPWDAPGMSISDFI